MKSVLYALLLAIPLVLSPVQAGSTDKLTVAMDAATYSAASTLVDGDAPIATVTLVDGEGAPLAGVEVRLVVIRQVQLLGYVGNDTIVGSTGADGTFTTPVGMASCLPGTYVVIARAGDLTAQTRYTIGA